MPVHFISSSVGLPAENEDQRAWMSNLLTPVANLITPTFVPARSSPQLAFLNDERQNEGLQTLQFLTLYQLLRESIKVGNGGLLLSLYKPLVSVFERYHRTKYR